jgi:negative regulator of flagellin synthesis FlgM
MSINVNGTQGPGVPETSPARDSTEAQRRPADPARRADAGTGQASGADRAEVTEAGRVVSEATRQLEEVPIVDEARVERLREAIESGGFEVDAERIAERLISFEDDVNG